MPSQDTQDVQDTLPVFPAWMPPHLRLMQLVAAKWISQPLLALARLNVADLLADGPRTVDELAEACGVLADPLRRCLRATAGMGVFGELPDGRFELTAMSRHLLTGGELSLHGLALFLGDESTARSFERIMDVLRTGEPSFEAANGAPLFAYLNQRPELGRTYRGTWSPLTAGVARALLKAVDFSAYPRIADLGGGDGTLLRAILEADADLHGILVDLPEVLDAVRAEADPARGPLASRITLAPAVFPAGIPSDADAYIIKNTLHCLDEGTVLDTLRAVRAAIGDRPEPRLLLIESVVTPGNGYDWGRFVDIELMINCGGRVHTLDEWRAILSSCGFELTGAEDLLPPQWLITARPR